MKKFLYITTLAGMMVACTPVTPLPTAAPVIPAYSYNAAATQHLKAMLGKTVKVAVCINDKELALTDVETAKLLGLLVGATSAEQLCAPADCFYLNMYDAEGKWLMSQPVQNTPEGIVLLYLKLQGINAGAPLQNWWQGIANRMSLR